MLVQTPIVRLGEDTNGNELYVKRDDLLPFCFGGNKARIALELLRDMQEIGCDHMIAYGNPRSNLCRVLSALCHMWGVPCTVLSPADDDGARTQSYNCMMAQAFGAQIVPCLKTGVAETVDAALAASQAVGHQPYYIYGDRTGQGNRATPVAAYAKVYGEIVRQEKQLGFHFDAIFHASGTGMTQAGLLCGAALAGDQGRRIVGVSIARSRENATAQIARYAEAYMAKAGKACEALPEIIVDDRFALRYGQSTPQMRRCIRDALCRYGMPLDATYTGKAFFGMSQILGEYRRQRVLFIHTGGTPLFFDQAREILDSAEGGDE